MVTSLFDISYAFGASPISRLFINLYALRVAQLCRIVSLFQRLLNGSLCPESPQVVHLFGVAHFARNGGSLYSGLVAQYGPDYSPKQITHYENKH